jgi:glycerol-3-phosphate dehydrogenase
MHAADGRLMFAVPRERFTYLGTTDTDYLGDPAQVAADRTDVAYILAATNRTFPQAGLLEADVVSTWAGLRALAAPPTETGPSQVSRDYKLFTSRSGLISVAGGKLTAFAAMARSIVQQVLPSLPNMAVPPALAGSVVPATTVNALATEFQVNATNVTALADRHGAEVGKVLAYLTRGTGSEHERLFAAEAAYAVDHEFAVQVTDVLIRRTGQLLFSEDHGQSVAKAVAYAMGRRLGWDEQTQLAQVRTYIAEITAMQAWRQETDTKVASVPV